MSNNLDHVAVILDGNKRWAKKNNFTNIYGYTKGFENINKLVHYSSEIKLSNLTIFALSSENFNRSTLNIIYKIIYENFSKIFDELIKNKGVKINIFGSRENLPEKIIEIFEKAENISSNNSKLNLNIAFNYGFRNEIKNILKYIHNLKSDFNFENENEVKKLFNLADLPDPDLLIRTGGHQRLSNFIMYNLTYTELFFTETLWPDFTEEEFISIVNKFYKINRKYGL